MRIGLLSDTHGYLDPKILDHFEGCDEIWHAGDIGELEVMRVLEKFRPVRAVHGNIDDKEIQIRYPRDQRFICGEVRVWITHIAGTPPRYNHSVRKELSENAPDLLICGHSHILKIGRDPTFDNMLFINPGAAGNQGFHHIKTIVRFEILNAAVTKMEVIELGKRGALN